MSSEQQEREDTLYDRVESSIVGRYRVEKTSGGFWPCCVVLAGSGTGPIFTGSKKHCDIVAAACQTACSDGAFMASEVARNAPDDRRDAARWISVKDLLPEKNTEVLIAFEGSGGLAATGQYTGSGRDHHGWCYPSECSDWCNGEWPAVAYWMPLPDVPAALAAPGRDADDAAIDSTRTQAQKDGGAG